MENCRILIITLILLVSVPLPAMAYSNANIGGHPLINKFAVQYFEREILPHDPLLVGTSLRGGPSWGYAWDETDGDETIGPRNTVSMLKKKLPHQWIEDGGYSADEPEYTMALVHFYDPANPHQAYLTDLRFLQEFVKIWDKDFVNPHLSAVDWAFDRDRGSGYYIQDYSWKDALWNYQAALASPSRENNYYGQAWRAVGETMHLVSDMTVPAHVRNDGHAWSDPYEDSVGSREVYAYAGGQPLPFNYPGMTTEDLMTGIARSVNENFYSADTVPYRTDSGIRYRYSYPSLEGLTGDMNGYYYSDNRILLREITCPVGGNEIHLYILDQKVLDDQREILIPTAIRASAEVLDRFLPRFDARLSIVKYLPDDPYDDQYAVHATLKQAAAPPNAWSGYPELIVRNGAYLVEITPDGRQNEILLSLTPTWVTPPPDPSFNDWNDLFKFKPGTRVFMKYDLGGYVVRSNEVVIPWPTPTITAKPTISAVTSIIPTPSQTGRTPAWGCVNTAACTPEHPENCCPGTSFSACSGCEKCCSWSDAANPVTGQKPQGFVIDAFCSCKTGERAIPA